MFAISFIVASFLKDSKTSWEILSLTEILKEYSPAGILSCLSLIATLCFWCLFSAFNQNDILPLSFSGRMFFPLNEYLSLSLK